MRGAVEDTDQSILPLKLLELPPSAPPFSGSETWTNNSQPPRADAQIRMEGEEERVELQEEGAGVPPAACRRRLPLYKKLLCMQVAAAPHARCSCQVLNAV